MCHKMFIISTKLIENKLHMNAELLRQQRRRPYFEQRHTERRKAIYVPSLFPYKPTYTFLYIHILILNACLYSNLDIDYTIQF